MFRPSKSQLHRCITPFVCLVPPLNRPSRLGENGACSLVEFETDCLSITSTVSLGSQGAIWYARLKTVCRPRLSPQAIHIPDETHRALSPLLSLPRALAKPIAIEASQPEKKWRFGS